MARKVQFGPFFRGMVGDICDPYWVDLGQDSPPAKGVKEGLVWTRGVTNVHDGGKEGLLSGGR